MSRTKIIPAIVVFMQLIGFIHLYLTCKNDNSHIPADFIELNILAVCNIGVLILAYFFYFKADIKLNIWLVPILLSTITIALLLVIYIIMGINKYK
ncbi:hypothetical protein OA88_02780 [Flavobacterium sp. JRM]|nr:hypothetical protein OA88_02780 [Flavobacterium sp. JRM]